MTTPTITQTAAEGTPITGTCDRCIAAAQTRITLIAGELQFCGHHYNRHAAALRDRAITIHHKPMN